VVSELPLILIEWDLLLWLSQQKKKTFLIVRGAARIYSILKNCSRLRQGYGGQAKFRELNEDIAKEGEEGKRVLALAFQKD